MERRRFKTFKQREEEVNTHQRVLSATIYNPLASHTASQLSQEHKNKTCLLIVNFFTRGLVFSELQESVTLQLLSATPNSREVVKVMMLDP